MFRHTSSEVTVYNTSRFEKCIKYANEMTDDVIHSTQYYIKYINTAILAKFVAQTIETW